MNIILLLAVVLLVVLFLVFFILGYVDEKHRTSEKISIGRSSRRNFQDGEIMQALDAVSA